MKKILTAGILLFGLLLLSFAGSGQTGNNILGISTGGQSVLGISQNGAPVTPVAPPAACIPCPGTPLPIELVSFTAERLNETEVELRWHTATELDNAGFEIQRKFGRADPFVNIDFVNGNGTIDWPSFYNYLDLNAYSGTTYYRLKQVDFDGDYAFSEIRAVSGYVTEQRLTIYPNPANDKVVMEIIGLSEAKNITVSILDAKGVCFYKKTNQFSADQPRLEVKGLGSYPEGLYFVYLKTEEWTLVRKFVHGQ